MTELPRPPEGSDPPLYLPQVQPRGRVTDAHPPIPVTVKVSWPGTEAHEFIDSAYVLAFTSDAVLAYWRDSLTGRPLTVWLPSDNVRRRET